MPSYWKSQHSKILGVNDFNYPKDYPIEEWIKEGAVKKKIHIENDNYDN